MTSQDKTGKELFEKNCASCHKPDKTFVAPPFQNIRADYGLKWVLKFVKNNEVLRNQKDSRALYIYYKYSTLQPSFDNLSDVNIIKILDYVDTFPVDTSLYQHRKISESERQVFIKKHDDKQQEQIDDLNKFFQSSTIDTPNNNNDSIPHFRRTVKRK